MFREVRQALSSLASERSFTLATLLTLALAIGANTAIFTVLNAVLLRPLPYAEPDRLVTLFNAYPKFGIERGQSSVPGYFLRREETNLFSSVGVFDTASANLGFDGAPERVSALRLTPSMFDVLAVRPALGRPFSTAEAEGGNEHVAILQDGLWRRRFAADPGVLGQVLRLNGEDYQIVGVMPPGFDLLDPKAQLLLPRTFTDAEKDVNSLHSNTVNMMARLSPGLSVGQAQERIDALNRHDLDAYPQFRDVLVNAGFTTRVVTVQEDMVRDVRRTLFLIQAGVALILLIGCVNVANLMLVRASHRGREFAVRFALGAGRWRVARQVLVEVGMLSLAGGALGLIVGAGLLQALTQLGTDALPRSSEIQMDATVVAFTFLVAAATGLLFGLIPVAQVLRGNLATVFRGGGRTASASRTTGRLRSSLVAAQLALAFVLLAAASLMLASFRKLSAVDPGFEPGGVLSAQIDLPPLRYPGPTEQSQLAGRLLAELRALPGVEAAALASLLPFSGSASASSVSFEGYQLAPGEAVPVPFASSIAGDLFATLRVPLLQGRTFTAADDAQAEQVVLIDRELAERYFHGDAVGKLMRQGVSDGSGQEDPRRWWRIVGVVGEVRTGDLTRPQTSGTVYYPLAQSPSANLSLLLRTRSDPAALGSTVRQAILRLDPELPLFDLQTMSLRLASSLTLQRAPMVLLGLFAAVALLLATVGIYGVVATTVAQRTREIGIRAALGARPDGITRLILGQGARLIALGLAVGLGLALVGGRWLQSLLFEVDAGDLRLLGLVAMVLAAVGLLACLVPSKRAARVDPVIALQAD